MTKTESTFNVEYTFEQLRSRFAALTGYRTTDVLLVAQAAKEHLKPSAAAQRSPCSASLASCILHLADFVKSLYMKNMFDKWQELSDNVELSVGALTGWLCGAEYRIETGLYSKKCQDDYRHFQVRMALRSQYEAVRKLSSIGGMVKKPCTNMRDQFAAPSLAELEHCRDRTMILLANSGLSAEEINTIVNRDVNTGSTSESLTNQSPSNSQEVRPIERDGNTKEMG